MGDPDRVREFDCAELSFDDLAAPPCVTECGHTPARQPSQQVARFTLRARDQEEDPRWPDRNGQCVSSQDPGRVLLVIWLMARLGRSPESVRLPIRRCLLMLWVQRIDTADPVGADAGTCSSVSRSPVRERVGCLHCRGRTRRARRCPCWGSCWGRSRYRRRP